MAQQVTQTVKEERSLGELFSTLATETGTLVRQEVALAQSEITRKAARVGTQVGYLVVGGAIGYAALLAIIAAIIIGVANFIPLWASALAVGLVTGAIAAFLIMSALKKLRETDVTPRQTVESIKEDAKWLKDQVS